MIAESISKETVNDRVMDAFKGMCNKYGGPAQYLQQVWGSKLSEFAAALMEQFPPDTAAAYWDHPNLQNIDPREVQTTVVRPMVVHPAMLCFNPDASVKAPGVQGPGASALSLSPSTPALCPLPPLPLCPCPPPLPVGRHRRLLPSPFPPLLNDPGEAGAGVGGEKPLDLRTLALQGNPAMHTCVAILEQILVDGFTSANDPLKVQEFPDDGNMATITFGNNVQTRAFRISYVKGMARSCTLLAISSMFIQDELNIREVLPGRREGEGGGPGCRGP